jgi:hypothetical protein
LPDLFVYLPYIFNMHVNLLHVEIERRFFGFFGKAVTFLAFIKRDFARFNYYATFGAFNLPVARHIVNINVERYSCSVTGAAVFFTAVAVGAVD